MTEAGDSVPGLLVSLMFSTCSQRSATFGYARHASPSPRHTGRVANALSFALRYQGRKRVHHADDTVARITAERIVQHLEASGFVLMKGPPRVAPRASGCRLGGDVMSSPRGFAFIA
jgi:hypothetical protein